jgi:hypothetical protein
MCNYHIKDKKQSMFISALRESFLKIKKDSGQANSTNSRRLRQVLVSTGIPMGQGSQRGMKITLPLIPSHRRRGTITDRSPLGGRGVGRGGIFEAMAK